MSYFEFEELLLKYGLIQFGRFVDEQGTAKPYRLNLDWMVSYPDVLRTAAFDVQDHFRVHSESIKQFERILCPFDALPVATAVSAPTGIPVIYSRQQGESAVVDLVGAYDINHPTLLITYGSGDYSKLCRDASRVGLKVTYELTLVESYVRQSDEWHEDTYRGGSITAVRALADIAMAQKLITERQRDLVKDWFR